MSSPLLNHFKQLTSKQYEAAFCMLGACVDRCPEPNWNAPVADLKFCQVAFHTLLYTDLYLGLNVESLREQPFHREHAPIFADYEELSDVVQQEVYEKSFIIEFLQHCRDKAAEVIDDETEETLVGATGFERLEISRAELHIYNIRHLHHHAAQLSLRLRLDTGDGIPWIGSGWHDI